MISKKDFKRFSEQYDEAFDNIVIAMDSVLDKVITMPLRELNSYYDSDIMVECIVSEYELDGHIVSLRYLDPLENNYPSTCYIGISEIAEKGEW
ncbi:hypothetical protein CHOTACABRAS_149 [Bacillus phage Chotacabras]|nr:hypothetical protein CHOTACABRAS_149 [Bacillus phage Chotacabras]